MDAFFICPKSFNDIYFLVIITLKKWLGIYVGLKILLTISERISRIPDTVLLSVFVIFTDEFAIVVVAPTVDGVFTVGLPANVVATW